MKLLSLELENFRQFVGSQRIDFALGGDEGNVTLIYGANGAGKTTLLNVFTWLFYGTLGSDVEQQERLITDAIWEQADIGDDVTCSATLIFEHDGTQYRLRRSISTRKGGPRQQTRQPDVMLTASADDGVWKNIESYTDILDQVLPERLAQFFFFNGERIEHLVQREAFEDIQAAIKTLLGLEQYERALQHLPLVEKAFSTELRKLGNSPAGKLVAELEAEKEKRERLLAEQKRLRGEVAHLKDEVETLDQLLRQHEATAQLQARRDEQRRALDEADQRLRDARKARTDILTRRSYRVWLADLLPEVENLHTNLHERGELPAPLKRQFVDERLQSGICICGTPLRRGEEPYAHVEQWRQKAGLAEVEGIWQEMRGQAKNLAEDAGDVVASLQRFSSEIAAASEAHRQAEDSLNEIAAQLQKVGPEDAQNLELRRNDARAKIQDHEFRLRDIDKELEAVSVEIKRLEDALKKAHSENAKVEALRRRVAITGEAARAIKLMLDTASESVRKRLDSRVRSVHSKITIKPFMPELNPAFELRLWRGEGPDRLLAPKSTGENQLLSLSFVGALAQVCKEQAERAGEAQLLGRIGGLYPIVMDAAFGNLDNNYREAIARALPGMTSQVVVLTSKSQAEGIVARELAPHVGAEHVICVHTTKPDALRESITVAGQEWDYVIPASDYDSAQLRKVG
ncbi:AAA family ATPase [Cryptosporangium sp. NPDC051539]|uniref:AAA family ATPase n=1 Tax=Cryptosporangium sp. NPDC051539 TaxID=3363962 RepID=UPI0037AFBD1C